MICEIHPQPYTCCYTLTHTCTHTRLLSHTISPHHNANNRIKPLCFGVGCLHLYWRQFSVTYPLRQPQRWLCTLRWPSPILATYHQTGINRNIFCNYRNAAAPSAVNYFNVCQTINRLTEPSVVPYSKTQKPAIDFHEAVYSAFYLLSLLRDDRWGY